MTAARAEAVVVAEPAPYSAQSPTFAWTDAVLPFYLAGMAVVAATVPSRHWRRICRALTIAGGTLSGRHSRRTANIASVLRGYHDDADAADIAWEQGIAHNEARLHCLPFYCGRRWHPDIRIDGLDHVEEALAQGRGAILWTQPMAYSDIVTKMAFHQAGHAISHLSRPAHGLTRSRLFAPLFNPIWTSVERRFLAERLVIEGGRVGPVMATITQRLAENKLVSITVGAQARQTCRVPFFQRSCRAGPGHGVAGSSPEIDDRVRCAGISGVHVAFDETRQEKLNYVVRKCREEHLPVPQLRVCNRPYVDVLNCCDCEKCLRTMTGIIVAGGTPTEFGFPISPAEVSRRVQARYRATQLLIGETLQDDWLSMQPSARRMLENGGAGDAPESVRDLLVWLGTLDIPDYIKRFKHRNRWTERAKKTLSLSPWLFETVKNTIERRSWFGY